MPTSFFLTPNQSGEPFTGQQIGPAADNTAAPPFTFLGDLNTGYASSAADTLDLVTGGTSRFSVTNSVITSTLQINGTDFRAGAQGTFFFTGGTNYRGVGNGTANFLNFAENAGVGIDVATDAILKIRTRAQNAYATVDALAYQVGGVAGIDTSITSAGLVGKTITVSKGIITGFV